ncbi:type VI secretion system baseplate subunit TssF, partial [Sulfurimonas sp. MAG313]
IETQLYLDPSKFTGIGEAYHLSCVLNEFFALYCNVNFFHRLVVHIENHETFEWAPKMGYKALV